MTKAVNGAGWEAGQSLRRDAGTEQWKPDPGSPGKGPRARQRQGNLVHT